MKSVLFSFIFSLLLIPHFVSAQIQITEIMYNPDGTDTDREWIEMYNSGPDQIDLTAYKIFENSVGHKISEFSGGKILLPNTFAVIADDPATFLLDFPSINLVFDSAFSFNNTGEEILVLDSLGETVDAVTYSSELGGNDTGNSLQKNGTEWIPAAPTPLETNAIDPADETLEADGDESTGSTSGSNSTHEEQTDVSTYKPKSKLQTSIGRNRHILINSPVKLELKHNQTESTGIRVIWSVGNGIGKSGKKISVTYDRSGEYNVVATARLDGNISVSRTRIFVTEPNIDFFRENTTDGTIDLVVKNLDSKEINIGGFYIKALGKTFRFKDDTILSAKQKLTLSQDTTRLDHFSEVKLYYPDGELSDILDPTEATST